MDVNLRAPIMLTHFFLHFLRQTKGVVINVTSDKASKAEPGIIGYQMSKAGVEMFTKSSAMELAPFGVRVNCVAPSFVDTNLYRYADLTDVEYDQLKKRAAANHPY